MRQFTAFLCFISSHYHKIYHPFSSSSLSLLDQEKSYEYFHWSLQTLVSIVSLQVIKTDLLIKEQTDRVISNENLYFLAGLNKSPSDCQKGAFAEIENCSVCSK